MGLALGIDQIRVGSTGLAFFGKLAFRDPAASVKVVAGGFGRARGRSSWLFLAVLPPPEL